MRKKLLAVLLALCVMIPLVAIPASAAMVEKIVCVHPSCKNNGEYHEDGKLEPRYFCEYCEKMYDSADAICDCQDVEEEDKGKGHKGFHCFWCWLLHLIMSIFKNIKLQQPVPAA